MTIICPYATYGCGMKELSDKNLDKHLIDYAQYHLNICANTLTKNQDKERIDCHQKYMTETLGKIIHTFLSLIIGGWVIQFFTPHPAYYKLLPPNKYFFPKFHFFITLYK